MERPWLVFCLRDYGIVYCFFVVCLFVCVSLIVCVCLLCLFVCTCVWFRNVK